MVDNKALLEAVQSLEASNKEINVTLIAILSQLKCLEDRLLAGWQEKGGVAPSTDEIYASQALGLVGAVESKLKT